MYLKLFHYIDLLYIFVHCQDYSKSAIVVTQTRQKQEGFPL